MGVGAFVAFLGIAFVAVYLNGQPASPQPTTDNTPPFLRERRTDPAYSDLDKHVDEAVERNWRPTPGGNSREDAKRVSKDIMRAHTWEELDQVIDYETERGR